MLPQTYLMPVADRPYYGGMSSTKYRLPFGSDLSAGYTIDGVIHAIDRISVEKVGAWIPQTDTEWGHYAELEFSLEVAAAPKTHCPPVAATKTAALTDRTPTDLRSFASQVRRTGLTKGRDQDVRDAVSAGLLSDSDAMNTDD